SATPASTLVPYTTLGRSRAAANRRQRRHVAQRRQRRQARRRHRRRRHTRFVVLHRGMRGPGVTRWQRKLTRALRGRVAIDGVFGSRTRRATRHFQRTRGLKPTGRVGRPTRRRMRRALR
ncbi:MAG: peptidoglycan-binding protein, partial [Actinobacteria bacterium]|nr:peptidoglycan-binding protein [Actinomycetota bacterium]